MLSRTYSLLLLAIVLMGSCSPIYYKPNRVNAPMLTDAGQVHFCVAPNNAQVAFSPVRHLGLIGNYAGYRHSGDYGREHARMFEVGAGYYGLIDTSRHSDRLRFVYDVYGGFGAGRIDVRNEPGYYYPDATLTRAFLQPGIGLRTRIFEMSFNWRVCHLSYSNLSAPPVLNGSPFDGSSYFTMEPALTLRCGYKAIKAELQYVHAMPLSNIEWNYINNTLNVGIAVLINGYR
ncbi:hypothetical protein GCM10023093_06070 [Nemorincola caseinilytica]|uniref:Outer membrane protein beta-barrel domain-containing protein n=1 Tax=Nemorincola caseinilytica TaxID=2054315 RepID=A0ABP8N507_9BACT